MPFVGFEEKADIFKWRMSGVLDSVTDLVNRLCAWFLILHMIFGYFVRWNERGAATARSES